MRLIPPLALLLLAACTSPYSYALDTGYPIEEPPCCNSSQLLLTAEDYIDPSLEGPYLEEAVVADPLFEAERW